MSRPQNERRITSLPISRRELEVLKLLCTGISPTRIAELLFISPETVKTHISNIHEKAGFVERNNRILIFRWAMEHGYVDPPVRIIKQ